MAKFKVSDPLPEGLRVGVFSNPGREFEGAGPLLQRGSASGARLGPRQRGNATLQTW